MFNLYENIDRYRILKGFNTMTELCRTAKVPPSSLTELKRGKTKGLSDTTLEKLSLTLNVSKDELQGRIAELIDSSIITEAIIKSMDSDIPHVEQKIYYDEPPKRIPIYGIIKAGIPALAEQQIIGYGYTEKKNASEYFYLIVNGDSMEPKIRNKSKVLIHKQETADNNDIVACIVNGEDATLKRFQQYGNVIYLLPENKEYQPIQLNAEDFFTGENKIIGVAKQVVEDL